LADVDSENSRTRVSPDTARRPDSLSVYRLFETFSMGVDYNYAAMTAAEFIKIWPVLKQQVKGLDLPWLDGMASRDKNPFRVLISCILRTR
jgi:hypothetical protein